MSIIKKIAMEEGTRLQKQLKSWKIKFATLKLKAAGTNWQNI